MKVGVVQLTATNDIESNWRKCQAFVEEAKAQGAQMVFLPENFDYVAPNREEALRLAQPLDGPLIQRYRELCRREGVWASLGGFHEVNSRGKLFNTHLVVDSSGEVAAVYRKYHLFDVDIPSGPRLMESLQTDSGFPGHPQAVVPSPVGQLGLSICYDLRFPELFRRMMLFPEALGASSPPEVLVVPATWTYHTGPHWEVLLRARAIENQVYVVASAQFGMNNENRRSAGQSMVVDPWGNVIAKASDKEGVIFATLDLNYLKEVRKNMPVLNHAIKQFYNKDPQKL
uniref:CN hydrolase domain-containing protein n=1 Tax=Arcella intermedia TaxID=1963864 RepID=A0A6B2LCE4_9EUKA